MDAFDAFRNQSTGPNPEEHWITKAEAEFLLAAEQAVECARGLVNSDGDMYGNMRRR